ncbi:hypothetical protein, partial [Flavobacterium filum]|uniref:hypothetical protein n=1 Tax=Flavobacterium filum TaxID=370974 RepID=UPI0023F05F92
AVGMLTLRQHSSPVRSASLRIKALKQLGAFLCVILFTYCILKALIVITLAKLLLTAALLVGRDCTLCIEPI